MATEINHEFFMRRAIELALKGTGTTSPNPRVGCVIASGSSVIAEGWHQRYGESHAEVNALKEVHSELPSDATMYVTLEPCSHFKKTPPCTDAIIASGIKHVVVGMIDPYPEVNGKGIERLNAFGITTHIGVLEEECQWINRFFTKRVKTRLPYVVLKLAQSIDGFIAPSNHQRLELTGNETRKVVHQLRSEVDAVLVGVGTVIADNPQLTVRDVPGRNPLRIVVDPNADTPLTSHIVQYAYDIDTMIITSSSAPAERVSALIQSGIEVIGFDVTDGEFDMDLVLQHLASEKSHSISSIMCEGGPGLASTLLEADIVDELRLHTAPVTISDGKRIDDRAVQAHWQLHDVTLSGGDVLATYIKSLPIVLLACILCSMPLRSQDGLSNRVSHLVDTALSVLGMNRSDCAMPPDLIESDPQRLPFHDTLFTNPFSVVSTLKSYRTSLEIDPLYLSIPVSRAISDMNLGLQHAVTFREFTKEADGTLPHGVVLPEDLNMVENVILKQFLIPFIETHTICQPLQQHWRSQLILFEQCDSLWMMANSDDTKSLFESYESERITRTIAEAFFSVAEPTSLQDVYRYGTALHDRIVLLALSLLSSADIMRDSVRTNSFETSLGRIGIGGPGNDVFEGSYAFIIDVGGDDVYRVRDPEQAAKGIAAKRPVTCIVDLEGDDVYLGGDFSLGAGLGGVGIVVDVSGNDAYFAEDFSIGCGLFGIGIVHDLSGDDVYSSGQNTQGAGLFGIGILNDVNGNDVYKAHAQAQGFGATRGVGILADANGNDNYIAASPIVDELRYYEHYTTFAQGAALGYRPLASGGIGMLIDLNGNDSYSADIYGQGTAYWFGLGAIIDRTGEDRYQAYQYAQGAGIHFATGVLLDSIGNDIYVSHGVSQGCGHDVGIGLMVDESGDDSYIVESLSLGGGNANAVSVFIDAEGDDTYSTRDTTNTMGYSDFRRWYGMIGVFADGGGTDRYTTTIGNNRTSTKASYGVSIDVPYEILSVHQSEKQPDVLMELSSNPDTLFIQASAAPLKYQAYVQPARDSLSKMGRSVLPLLEVYIGTPMPRERLTLEYVFPELYKIYPHEIDSILYRTLNSTDYDVVVQSATIAGKVKSTFVAPTLIEMLQDTSWKKRRVAAQTLGQVSTSSFPPQIVQSLSDKHPYVRARAAYTIGETGGTEALNMLRLSLSDTSAMVRYAAVEGLQRGARHSFTDIAAVWKSTSATTLPSSIRLLATCDTTIANAIFFNKYYKSADPYFQSTLHRTLSSLPRFWTVALTTESKHKKRKK